MIWCIFLVSCQQTSGVPFCFAPVNRVWCCDHKYLQSDKYIYLLAFSRFFVSFSSLAFSSFSSSSFVCSEFLSAISQKFKQESIEIYFLFEEKIFFLLHICFFLFAFIVPLFYTEKGNCFSLTRFTTFYFFSLSRIQIFQCIFLVCVI